MDRIRVRRLAPPERRRLRSMERAKGNAVKAKRARVILLSAKGRSTREIAEAVGYTVQWVRKVIHRFNEGGLKAIDWDPGAGKRGRRRKLSARVIQRIVDTALSPPQQLIGMTQWSLAKLRQYLIEQGIVEEISLEWLRQILTRAGVRWRRTKTWKESKDPQFVQKSRQIRGLYERRPEGGRRICVDEFGPLNLVPRPGMCWEHEGSQRPGRLPATYRRDGGVRHLLAFYDLETGRLDGWFYERKRTDEFLDFLKRVRSCYPVEETLHVVLDNYGPHLSSRVLEWAEANNMLFYFTPTNASWLNRIECHFAALKKFALAGSYYRSHGELQAAIKSYLAWHNGERPIACGKPRTRRRANQTRRDPKRPPKRGNFST